MEVRAKRAKKISYHVLAFGLLATSIVLMFVRFEPVFGRVLQSLEDLIRSVLFYFSEILEVGTVRPTVNVIPSGMKPYFPTEWGVFKGRLELFFKSIFDKTNLQLFFAWYGEKLGKVARVLLLLLIPTVLFGLVAWLVYGTPNTDHNKDTKPLKAYKWICKNAGTPVKNYVVGLWRFIKGTTFYRWFFAIVWIYNLQLLTIQIEALAFVFYFSISVDFKSIYTQFVKLAIDSTMAIGFLPWWIWLAIGWKIFSAIRQTLGMARLRHFEKSNRAFLDTYPGALFLVGKQRAKKTTIITDMALTQEVIFKDEAKARISECDKQFPFFPWINVELFYKEARTKHALPTLAHHREFVRLLHWHFDRDRKGLYDQATKKSVLRNLRKRYGYKYEDFIFEYDHERYGTKYNNALVVLDVFETIENYIQLFFIYAAPTSLIFGNYPIRTDLKREDEGNFPSIDGDFFDRPAEEVEATSQYSHPINFNASRLGKVTDENDPYKDGREIGINTVMEFAKERGNQNTNAGLRADDDECNPKNDGYELNTKMKGHDATIMYFTFNRDFFDDQRPDSLSAENKDLCDIIMIRGVDGGRIVMPGFAWGELIHLVTSSVYDNIYYKFRKKRGDNTLLVYVMKQLFGLIHKRYDRIKNQFTVQVAKLKIWDAMGDDVLTDKGKYYVSHKKVYSNRFATDGIKDFYHRKALRSKVGLNDYPTFGDVHMTVQEMRGMHSRFYNQIDKIFRKGEIPDTKPKQKSTKRKAA